MRITKFKIIILLCAFIAPFSFIKASNIILNNTELEYSLIDKIYILEDESNSLSIEEIVTSNNFQLHDRNNINFGFTYSTQWLRFTIKNPTDNYKSLIYSINYPFIHTINIFEVCNSNIQRTIHTGLSNKNKSSDIIAHRNYIFEIGIEPGQEYTYYVSLFNDGNTIDAPMYLKTSKHFIERDNISILFYGLFYGTILFILIFNFFYNYALNEKISIYYTLYVVFASVYILNLSGIGKQLFFTYNSETVFIISGISIFLINFCLLSFSTHFLELKKIIPTIKKGIDVFKYFNLLLIAYIIFTPYIYIAAIFAILTIIISFILLFIATYHAIKNKISHSKYFLIGYLFGFVGVLIYVMKQMKIIEDSLVGNYSLQVAFFIENFIFFFAFLKKIKTIKKTQQIQLVEKNKKIEAQKLELIKANVELEKLSVIARETNNSIIVFNNMGYSIWVNHSFTILYPDIDDVNYKHISKIYNNNNLYEILENCIKNKQSYRFSSKRLVDGKSIYIQTNLTPTFDEHNNIKNFIAIDSNITQLISTQEELKEAKNKAEQASKLKTAIMTNVSHELRTPLNAIIGFTDLILYKKVKEEKLIQFIKLINNNGIKLLDQIEGLLDIVRIETGDVITEKTDFDVNQMINELHQHYELVRQNESKQNIEILSECFNRMPTSLHSDRRIIKQIFCHLLNNSLKFTQKGYVKLGYYIMKNEITFFVEDTGIGINQNDINIALEPFRQVDDSITRGFGGTGIGLSIAKGLIDLLGGTLKIDGRKGIGTTISFTMQML